LKVKRKKGKNNSQRKKMDRPEEKEKPSERKKEKGKGCGTELFSGKKEGKSTSLKKTRKKKKGALSASKKKKRRAGQTVGDEGEKKKGRKTRLRKGGEGERQQSVELHDREEKGKKEVRRKEPLPLHPLRKKREKGGGEREGRTWTSISPSKKKEKSQRLFEKGRRAVCPIFLMGEKKK